MRRRRRRTAGFGAREGGAHASLGGGDAYVQMEPYVYLTCTYVYAQMEPFRSRAAGEGVYFNFIYLYFLYLHFILYFMGAYGRRGASAATVRVPLGLNQKP
jgi:hypothetical protein